MADALVAFREALGRCSFALARNQKVSLKNTWQRLADAVLPDEQADVYGAGPLINDFEQQLAQMLGKEAALFLPSGTMAQCLAMKIYCQDALNHRIGLHPTSHLLLHEQQAYQALYGLEAAPIGPRDAVPSLGDMQAAHQASPLAALLLELPMREIGGQLPPWDALVAQCQWATEQGIRLHLDGARLWQCPAAYGRSLAEIAGLFDSVYVSFYKDLGGIAGAVLAGDRRFINEARIWLRRAGGNLYSLAPYVVAAREGLGEHLGQMPKRLAHARWLAEQFNALEGFSTWPLVPHTNMFRMRIDCEPHLFMEKACHWMAEHDMALVTAPYRVDEHALWCEITLGSAFEALPQARWQEALEDFHRQVMA
ncbi:MAG: beta-eliminating lyase-related protein [Pseudomonadota bacterium]|uniref:threonine aldolase family protein n=1 Tax=Gallaecimonas pentaromativorans TaxID=584787 RepID=UPI00067F4C90|nr:beta-eliminating lyase-related protein [Gallaecimonas pentaromativorans]MED5523649.1 beta-eliminating lyase-related protein [Pseudomonadota bacterium]